MEPLQVASLAKSVVTDPVYTSYRVEAALYGC